MDFNFKKFTSDAAAVFSRAVQVRSSKISSTGRILDEVFFLQFTEEKFGKAERTELDAHFESLLQRADKTEEHTKRILGSVEGYLQPNPSKHFVCVFRSFLAKSSSFSSFLC